MQNLDVEKIVSVKSLKNKGEEWEMMPIFIIDDTTYFDLSRPYNNNDDDDNNLEEGDGQERGESRKRSLDERIIRKLLGVSLKEIKEENQQSTSNSVKNISELFNNNNNNNNLFTKEIIIIDNNSLIPSEFQPSTTTTTSSMFGTMVGEAAQKIRRFTNIPIPNAAPATITTKIKVTPVKARLYESNLNISENPNSPHYYNTKFCPDTQNNESTATCPLSQNESSNFRCRPSTSYRIMIGNGTLMGLDPKKLEGIALDTSRRRMSSAGGSLGDIPRFKDFRDSDESTAPSNRQSTTQNKDQKSINTSHKLDEERIAHWAVSFDNLLHDPIGIKIFEDFLIKEYSEENIEFWKACESLKQIKDPIKMESKAKDIFEHYVADNAACPVNINDNCRQRVKDNIVQEKVDFENLYDIAQTQIYNLMKYDSYARFLKSDDYKNCLLHELSKRANAFVEATKEKKDNKNIEDTSKKWKTNMFFSKSKLDHLLSNSLMKGMAFTEESKMKKQYEDIRKRRQGIITPHEAYEDNPEFNNPPGSSSLIPFKVLPHGTQQHSYRLALPGQQQPIKQQHHMSSHFVDATYESSISPGATTHLSSTNLEIGGPSQSRRESSHSPYLNVVDMNEAASQLANPTKSPGYTHNKSSLNSYLASNKPNAHDDATRHSINSNANTASKEGDEFEKTTFPIPKTTTLKPHVPNLDNFILMIYEVRDGVDDVKLNNVFKKENVKRSVFHIIQGANIPITNITVLLRGDEFTGSSSSSSGFQRHDGNDENSKINQPEITIKRMLTHLCRAKHLNLSAVDVYLQPPIIPQPLVFNLPVPSSPKREAIDLNQPFSRVFGKDLYVEKRIIFEIILSINGKCVGVKTKPGKTLLQVLTPILSFYNIDPLTKLAIYKKEDMIKVNPDDQIEAIDRNTIIVCPLVESTAENVVVKKSNIQSAISDPHLFQSDMCQSSSPSPSNTEDTINRNKIFNDLLLIESNPQLLPSTKTSITKNNKNRKISSKRVMKRSYTTELERCDDIQ